MADESLLPKESAPPPPPPPEQPPGDNNGGNDNNSGGSSSGGTSSSGSSSSGGSSEPPVDPVIAQKTAAFGSVYMRLWGEPATQDYLKAAAHSGMNVWEFEWRERHKPAFAKTKTYRDEGDALVAFLKNSGVV